MNIIFDAECLMCGERKGIELPENIETMIRITTAKHMVDFDFGKCMCGGHVDIQAYRGKLDKDRNVIL